jgi:hypothetical protein
MRPDDGSQTGARVPEKPAGTALVLIRSMVDAFTFVGTNFLRIVSVSVLYVWSLRR